MLSLLLFVEDTMARIASLEEEITSLQPFKVEYYRLGSMEAKLASLRSSMSELHATLAERDAQIFFLK